MTDETTTAFESDVSIYELIVHGRLFELYDQMLGEVDIVQVLHHTNRVMRQILDQDVHFTGVITYGPGIAAGAIRAMHEEGIKVPEDVSVICAAAATLHDHLDRPLTHVTIDRESMADQAFQRLVWRFDNMDMPPEDLKNPVRLVPGATSIRIHGNTEKDKST